MNMTESLMIRSWNHKLDHSDTTTQINRDTAKFAQNVNMIDRVGKLEERSAYILFKDHKKKLPR